MKKSLLVGSLVGMAVLFSGCATILDGTTQKINLTASKPTKVKIDNKEVTAPAIVSVKRENKDLIITNEKCGQQKVLNKKVNPTFFVNILSGGVFGSTTDYATGAMWKYDDNVNVPSCPQK